jgi:protease-4
MALNADTLLDRIYLKGQITKWRVLAIVFGVIALIALGSHNMRSSGAIGDYIARITIDGIITDNKKIYNLIDDVAANNRIKAVVLWLDTPGGSAVGGEETFLHLRALAAKKPVVAVMRSVTASAGYMTALGADRIYAREGTITGSIGVIIESVEVTELADKLGIKPVIIKSAPLKGSPSPAEKMTPEATRVVQDVVDDFYSRFVDMVAERRHLPRPTVVQLADGRIYSGRRAMADKLIDAIGGEQEAVQWLVSEKHVKSGLDVKDVKVEQENSFFDQFTQSVAGKFFSRSSVGLDGLSAIWHPQLN